MNYVEKTVLCEDNMTYFNGLKRNNKNKEITKLLIRVMLFVDIRLSNGYQTCRKQQGIHTRRIITFDS